MKKTLLLFAMAYFAFACINAQGVTKVWNFGGDATIGNAWATSAGIGNGTGTTGNPPFPVMIDGLGLTGLSTNTNFGAITAGTKTFGTYSFVNRFQFNGAGYTGATIADLTPTVFVPTQRFVTIAVGGNSSIYVIGITGSSGDTRRMFVTEGTSLLGTAVFPAGSAAAEATITYTGPATTLYLFCNASCNLYYLSATNVVSTSVKQVLSDKGITFNGSEISNTKNVALEVYNVLGKKIANSTSSISTKNFLKGVYVVRIAGSNNAMKIYI